MKYRYCATDKMGKWVRGELEADSPRDARQWLRERQLAPQQLKQVSARTSLRRGIAQRDFVMMMRQLATLTGANLPLAQSLQVLESQSRGQRQQVMLQTLRQKVQEGCSLAEVVAHWPANFTPLYCAMIAAGEASGKLHIVLQQLADYSEKSLQLKRRFVQAMVYPLLLTCVALIVVIILVTVVVPEIVGQFTHMQQQLPLSTRALMQISDWTRQYGPAVLVFLSATGGVLRCALHHRVWRQKLHRGLLRLPCIGAVVIGLNLARYVRALSILLLSAVPLLEAMAISANVIGNDYIRQQLQLASDRVREGATFSTALEETGLLTPLMSHMISCGEQSGEMGDMLKRTADSQEQMFTDQMTLVVTIFEPVLVVTLSGVVLFIVLAILQPILQLNNFTG